MTYPNVLVMGYLEETGQLTPEWRMKLEAALNAGWQRLLTFEISGGGFDWYGQAPAKTLLTAYGILMLSDMDRVYPIDGAVIDRARDLLYGRQEADGSWKLDVPVHTWGRLDNARLPVTAYIVWALKEAGFDDANVRRAEGWLRRNSDVPEDGYVRALVALALGDKDSIAALESAAIVENEQARWTTSGEGIYHARGNAASIEATAMATLALLRSDASTLDEKGLTAIAGSKDANGSWHSTQATILCIKALLEATRTQKSATGKVRLAVNGREIPDAFKPIEGDYLDVVQQVEIPAGEGATVVELTVDGEARPNFQVAGRYWLPWSEVDPAVEPPLEIGVAYDRDELRVGERLPVTATLTYRGPGTFMIIADLGIPPGFSPDPAEFDALVRNKKIDKFTLTGRQITLYLGRITRGQTIKIPYTLTPRFPIEAKAPGANTYEYYSPDVEMRSTPTPLRVKD